MRPDYPIKTDRLLLRPFTPADLDDYAAYRTDPEVNRYLLTVVTDRAGTSELLARKAAQTELTGDGQGLSLAVHWPEAGRVVGDVVLKWLSEEHRQGEIGYVFNPEFQGRGLAGEAAGALLRFGFEELGLHRVIARAAPGNEASWRVMERLGMRREAHYRQNRVVKGEWADLYTYAVLAQEWRARR
ncbi:GNAT family protein [Lentzea sp. NPDC042327]|uniref:GNAT family N-acetyltransferase n=1 Tax=Lentzea sp. NPDC042327 TaxID=3154801 RepID=UPI0034039ACC